MDDANHSERVSLDADPATGCGGIERPHWGVWVAILSGMGLLGLLALSPGAHAWWSRSVTTATPRWLLQGVFVWALLLHVYKGMKAVRMAERAGLHETSMSWGWQTFALGFPSLWKLEECIARGRAGAGGEAAFGLGGGAGLDAGAGLGGGAGLGAGLITRPFGDGARPPTNGFGGCGGAGAGGAEAPPSRASEIRRNPRPTLHQAVGPRRSALREEE